ncbi:MAG: hypothetical protein HRT90_11755 [Candidatus Margulisbacteria bacterium]|nr:hypothetical protein [Candidatus Margulisiibacteriota bacterium]
MQTSGITWPDLDGNHDAIQNALSWLNSLCSCCFTSIYMMVCFKLAVPKRVPAQLNSRLLFSIIF